MNGRIFSAVGVAAMLVFVSIPAHAGGDAQAGAQKNAMCQGCHGIDGFRMAYPKVYSVPKLGGQSAAYIVAALKAYRAGDRANENMKAIAVDLSDQDIDDLAAYYSGGSQ